VQSEAGTGSTFTVLLDRERAGTQGPPHAFQKARGDDYATAIDLP